MVKITPVSEYSTIGEFHLYTIITGLEVALKIYKEKLEYFKNMEYNKMSSEEIHLMKWHESKIYDTEKLLKEL